MQAMEIKVIENQNQIYVKEKLLGQGAFGKAYLVQHKPTGEKLVIKEMNIQHMSSKQKQETVKQAQILRNLSHPNIVNFREVYITKNNKLKIVMEYAQCGDLAKTVSARKAKKQYFTEVQILDWFTQICLAIKHVHDRKILHRDIKGQNIFIAKNNSLKLGDFGIARVLNMTHDKARTVVGTPYYLSPEIIQNKPYSFKSDIWSIGAVLYELCALQPPFQANSLQMLALKIVKGSYTPIQQNYSKQLKSLIAQMLTIDPNKRPNIQEILQKPAIQGRIRNFLSETKRISQFSHTILHNQKVQIFANKLVQIQKEKQSIKKSSSNEKNIEMERKKLKQQQLKMQQILLKKREQEQNRKKAEQLQRRQYQIKRRDQQRLRQKAYQQQKKQKMQRQYEQNQRMAEINRQRRKDEQMKYQRQMEFVNMQRQREDQIERSRKQAQNARKQNKHLQEQRKKQQFAEQARQQYFQNQRIRKMAEQRARRQQQGNYEAQTNYSSQEPVVGSKQNFHYAQQNQGRPQTNQQQRRTSVEKKQNNSDLHTPSNSKKQPQVSQQQLINAFCNPNYKKGSEKKKQSVQKKETDSNKKLQVKKNGKPNQSVSDFQTQQTSTNQQPQEVSKWSRKRSSSKKHENQSENQSPRFRGNEQKNNPNNLTETQKQKEFHQMIDQSQNLYLQAKNPQQFEKYLEELQGILEGVNKKIEMFPDIPMAEQIKFRDDDIFELSLTALPIKKQFENQAQQVDLDVFSNYSKLQTLRMQLEEALGLQNFIKLYRYMEEQIRQKGLQNFNMYEAIKQVGGDIDSKVVNKNITLLLTLVALQDRMSYT